MTRKLGDLLISHGVIDEEKLVAALSDQRAFGGKLGRTLVDLGYVTEDQLIRALSQQLGLPTVDLDHTEAQPDALQSLPVDVCERYGVFPVSVDGERVLRLATAEPDRQTLQELAQLSQHTLEPLLASMSSIDRAIRRCYFGDSGRRTAPTTRLGEPLSAIPADMPADGAAAIVPNPYAIGTIAPSAGAQDALQELKTLIIRLEKTVDAQSRAFRALVDLLQDKGLVRRGELGHRTTRR